MQLTANTQPAILVVSIAAYRVVRAMGLKPDFVAGHSLGEYSALVAAGALDLSSAVKLVRNRGAYMQQAVPVGKGAMAAIIGADASIVEEVCSRASGSEVCSPANINSPSQIVIAGDRSAVERAIEELKARKAGRARLLPVSAPFHCALMKPAEEALAKDLAAVEFKDLEIPLVNNADARAIKSGAEARDGLIRQVCSPVRWNESVKQLLAAGVSRFIEIGPKNVLAGLIKQIAGEAAIFNVEDSDAAQRVADAA